MRKELVHIRVDTEQRELLELAAELERRADPTLTRSGFIRRAALRAAEKTVQDVINNTVGKREPAGAAR